MHGAHTRLAEPAALGESSGSINSLHVKSCTQALNVLPLQRGGFDDVKKV